MNEMLVQWVAFVRGDLRSTLDDNARALRDRRETLVEGSGPLAGELLAGRIAAAERRRAELELERETLSRTVATRRDAYLAAVEAAFVEAETALPGYQAARARDDLAAATEALGKDLGPLSPAQLSAFLEDLQVETEALRDVVRRRFASAAATLADGAIRSDRLERARERHAAANDEADARCHDLVSGRHAVSDQVRRALESMTQSQLQDLMAFLEQALSDAEAECVLAPRGNVFEELDAWR